MSDTSQTNHEMDKIAARAASELLRVGSGPLTPGLYLIATPIGNLSDITLRALSVLGRADVIYCEDTRHSRTLLQHYSISRPLRPYHEHNAEEQRPRIISELGVGKFVALISDAGTPLISDPGYKLVRQAVGDGFDVIAIPGASATLTGLSVSGLPTDAFFFAGFLPPREGQRRARLAELKDVPGTLVFFEAPTRLSDTLSDLAQELGNRPAAVARELTKLHENVTRAPLRELMSLHETANPKGEIVVLVGPPISGGVTDEEISDRVSDALAHMSLRDAAKAVAESLKVPRSRVYDLALRVKSRAAD